MGQTDFHNRPHNFGGGGTTCVGSEKDLREGGSTEGWLKELGVEELDVGAGVSLTWVCVSAQLILMSGNPLSQILDPPLGMEIDGEDFSSLVGLVSEEIFEFLFGEQQKRRTFV